MLSYLYKAIPLPQELKFDIINELKQSNNFEILALIAECLENHDDILTDNYELQLFENGQYNVKYLTLAHPLLQYGTYQNKRKVALAIKCNVGMFNEENQFVEKMKDEIRFKVGINVGSKEQIRIKVQKIFDMINETVQEKNQNTIFAIIARDLQKSIEGIDEEKQLNKKLQENEFKFLDKLLQDREDAEIRNNAANSGIIEALHNIFTTRNLDEILYFHFLAFFQFTWPYNAEMSRILVDKKSFDFLLRLLDHKNTKVVNESINAMVNIMYGGTIGLDENQVHPYYNELISVGGIEKIYSLFKRNLKTSKDTASKCLGIAFKAQKIEDKTMRKKIITHLKSIFDRNDEEVEHALRCLSQNSDNRVEIEKNGFNLSDKKDVQ
ncbi:MAG: hypothetical protein EZS28_021256 [Streblomastix strix]|uniref:Uncharacterized protein n=1 Tax=Streblomastix strix TaxID=222440 RepID=A0A5J4VKP2_9EUKA|nr:MAG: hypothetical protein EZS28_021256 [Streblomastix strix]